MTTPSDDCYACAKMIISCPVHDVKPTADISASIDLRDDSDHESNSECEDSPQTCEWCGKTYDDDTAMSVHHWLSFGKYACDGPLCEECENNMTNEQMRYCVKTQDCDDCDCSCARAIDEDTQPGGQKERLEKIDGSKKVWPEPSPTISPRLSSFLSLSFPTLSKMSSVSTPISHPDSEVLVFTDKHYKQYLMTIAQWKKTPLPDRTAGEWFKATALSSEGDQYDHWVPAYYMG